MTGLLFSNSVKLGLYSTAIKTFRNGSIANTNNIYRHTVINYKDNPAIMNIFALIK